MRIMALAAGFPVNEIEGGICSQCCMLTGYMHTDLLRGMKRTVENRAGSSGEGTPSPQVSLLLPELEVCKAWPVLSLEAASWTVRRALGDEEYRSESAESTPSCSSLSGSSVDRGEGSR